MRKFKHHPLAFPIFCIVVISLLSAWVPVGHSAYEEIVVSNGGNIKGTVYLNGPIPKRKRYNLVISPDPYYCGRVSDGKGWRLSPALQVGPNREVPNVLVFLERIQAGKAASDSSKTIKAIDCQFSPYFHSIMQGGKLTFENWDPVQHELEIYLVSSKGGKLLSTSELYQNPSLRKSDFLLAEKIGLNRPGIPTIWKVPSTGRMVFRCSYHDYMEGWGMSLNHPYYSVTAEDGQYVIKDIPAGTYTLVLWHPLGENKTLVDIRPKETLDLDLEFLPMKSMIQPEENLEPNPFGIDLIGDQHIVPSVELQKEIDE